MSKIKRGLAKGHNRRITTSLFLLFSAFFSALSLTQIIEPSTASAQSANQLERQALVKQAEEYCRKYPVSSADRSAGNIREACENGYKNGNGSGTTCVQYTGAADAACRDGYNQKRTGNPGSGVQPTPPPSATPTDPGTGNTGTSADPDAGADTDPNDKDAVTCAVEKIGWIVCPIVEQSAKMSDKLFQFLAGSFLEVEPELLSGDSGTKLAWDQAITLANIAFVIAFVIIIISQVTGAGISNYGIKRMLPRLIVAAIAVNASYWICQGMVDLSNILGYNVMEALKQIAHNVGPSAFENNQASTTNQGDGFLGGLTVAVLAAAAVVWLFLAIMGGTIFIILITCLVIIIILLMRKAFIILLVVVSPFAFVAYLLPNTEKLFNKWLHMFWQLLLVFPIVALLLGGGQLASAIILKAGSEPVAANPSPAEQEKLRAEQEACDANDTTQNAVENEGYKVRCEPKVQNTTQSGEVRESGAMIGLVAAGVAVAPLLAVWAVLKGALAAAGAIGGKIAGAVQSGGGRLGKAGAGKMGDRMGKTALGRGMAMRKGIKSNYKDQQFAKRMAGGRRGYTTRFAARGVSGNAGKLAEKIGNTELGKKAYINQMTGGIQAQNSKLNANFAGAAQKADSEELKNELTAIEYAQEGKLAGAQNAFDEAIATGNTTKAKAAMSALATSGEKGIDSLAEKIDKAQASGNHELVNALREFTMQSHGNIKEKNAAIHAWATSGTSSASGNNASASDHAANATTYAKLSDAQFATQTASSLNSDGAKAALGHETQNAEGLLETRGHRLLSNPENAKNFSDDKRKVIADHGGNVAPH